MSTAPTKRILSDLDIEMVAEAVIVKLIAPRKPGGIPSCDCGACKRCRSRASMARLRSRRRGESSAAAAGREVDEPLAKRTSRLNL